MRSRRRRRFLKGGPKNEEMSLQITSMADIFMILLVFLLKSFSTTVSSIGPTKGLALPEAHGKDEVHEAIKLEIGKDAILVDGKPVVTLKGFGFEPTDLERDGTPRPLNAALIEAVKRAPAQAGKPLMVMADRDAPYSTVQAVLGSAGNGGFADLKLVVVEGN